VRPRFGVWCEHEGGQYWPWDWTILRVVIGKQELRTDLALNNWSLGIALFETDDWSALRNGAASECRFMVAGVPFDFGGTGVLVGTDPSDGGIADSPVIPQGRRLGERWQASPAA
jgi:hypothetical protein